ncbi:hypothetical protein P9112_004161 [Eukaryota sp. TZLM1-RC]
MSSRIKTIEHILDDSVGTINPQDSRHELSTLLEVYNNCKSVFLSSLPPAPVNELQDDDSETLHTQLQDIHSQLFQCSSFCDSTFSSVFSEIDGYIQHLINLQSTCSSMSDFDMSSVEAYVNTVSLQAFDLENRCTSLSQDIETEKNLIVCLLTELETIFQLVKSVPDTDVDRAVVDTVTPLTKRKNNNA